MSNLGARRGHVPDDDEHVVDRQVASHLGGFVTSLTVLNVLLLGYLATSRWGRHSVGDGLIVLGVTGLYTLLMWLPLRTTLRRAYDDLPIRDDLRLGPARAARRRGLVQGAAAGSLFLTLFFGLTQVAAATPSILLLAFPYGGTAAAYLEYRDLVRWQRSRGLRLCRHPGGRRFLASRIPTSESHVFVRVADAP